ncbi:MULTISPECIES: DUF2071 domain-containing protein [unclassified Hydrotalea]|uniref:DUF2071 domain-containing protein n=1 Tax=Hydrotalea TaxID=1004300 RepID=UPI00102710CA|nr:MAG: hypothetical protein EO766_06270 [Hydrotalea sp. AMD]
MIFCNYIVSPEILIPHVPPGTKLDYFEGNTYVSLVGFYFTNTALKGISISFYRQFEEFNLRFYVRFKKGNNLEEQSSIH